jgi:hypothetical protein
MCFSFYCLFPLSEIRLPPRNVGGSRYIMPAAPKKRAATSLQTSSRKEGAGLRPSEYEPLHGGKTSCFPPVKHGGETERGKPLNAARGARPSFRFFPPFCAVHTFNVSLCWKCLLTGLFPLYLIHRHRVTFMCPVFFVVFWETEKETIKSCLAVWPLIF